MRPARTFAGRNLEEKDFWDLAAAKLFTVGTGEMTEARLAAGGITLEHIPATTGNYWTLTWNTPMLFNGNYNIYAEIDFATDAPAISVPVTVTVSNVISFPNYFSRVFGDWMWIYAQTISNTAYQIDMYDENTNYLGSFLGNADSNGAISFLWDLSGLADTNFYGVFTVDTSSLSSISLGAATKSVNTSSPNFQTSSPTWKTFGSKIKANDVQPNAGGSSASAIQLWVKEPVWPYNNNNYVVAYGPFDNGYAAGRQNLAMLGGGDGTYGGVIHALDPYNLNNNLSPGNVD
jgi:hypothetical protein